MTVCLLGTALGEDCWSLCPNMHCLHLCFMARWRWNSRALRRCQQWVGALFVLFLYWGHYFVLLYFPSFSLLGVKHFLFFSLNPAQKMSRSCVRTLASLSFSPSSLRTSSRCTKRLLHPSGQLRRLTCQRYFWWFICISETLLLFINCLILIIFCKVEGWFVQVSLFSHFDYLFMLLGCLYSSLPSPYFKPLFKICCSNVPILHCVILEVTFDIGKGCVCGVKTKVIFKWPG